MIDPSAAAANGGATTSAVEWFAALPETVHSLRRHASYAARILRYLEESVRALDVRLDGIEGRLRSLDVELQGLRDHQAAIDLAAHQNAVLSDQHFESHVLEPLIRRLIGIIDLLTPGAGAASDAPRSGAHHDVIAAIHAQLLDLLSVYGVEGVATPEGSPFVSKSMIASELRPTSEPGRIGTIAATVRMGFRKGERVVRPAHVSVYCAIPKGIATNAQENNDHATDHRD